MNRKIKSVLLIFAFAVTAGLSLPMMLSANAQNTEQFTRAPVGSVDIASGVWDTLPAYDCNNLLDGKNTNGTAASYQLMWNGEKIFFGFTAHDTTPNNKDKIEISVKYKEENWGYIFATFAPWVGLGQFGNRTGNAGYEFIDSKTSADGTDRSIYFAVTLRDKTCLRAGEALTINMNYYDYAHATDADNAAICRLQSGILRSGDACFFLPFADVADSRYKETPDLGLYDDILYPDKVAADAVIRKINAIGEVTLQKETTVVEARAAYDAVTSTQKEYISATVLAVLTDAEKTLAALKNPGGDDPGDDDPGDDNPGDDTPGGDTPGDNTGDPTDTDQNGGNGGSGAHRKGCKGSVAAAGLPSAICFLWIACGMAVKRGKKTLTK